MVRRVYFSRKSYYYYFQSHTPLIIVIELRFSTKRNHVAVGETFA